MKHFAETAENRAGWAMAPTELQHGRHEQADRDEGARKTPKAAELKRTQMMTVGAVVKTVASKTRTTTVLASAIFQVGCKTAAAGMNPTNIKRGMGKADKNAVHTEDSCWYTGTMDATSSSAGKLAQGCVTGFKDVNASTASRASLDPAACFSCYRSRQRLPVVF